MSTVEQIELQRVVERLQLSNEHLNRMWEEKMKENKVLVKENEQLLADNQMLRGVVKALLPKEEK